MPSAGGLKDFSQTVSEISSAFLKAQTEHDAPLPDGLCIPCALKFAYAATCTHDRALSW